MDSSSSTRPSLQVILDGVVIFTSYGKWLYPLFDLEDYIKQHRIDMSQVKVHDKVIGKAAAFLIVRLQIGQVHGDLMSDLAINVFKENHTPYSFTKQIERIDCQTEEILLNIERIDTAYDILCKRAKRC